MLLKTIVVTIPTVTLRLNDMVIKVVSVSNIDVQLGDVSHVYAHSLVSHQGGYLT